MRKDMFKVIVERPRRGAGLRVRRKLNYVAMLRDEDTADFDEVPSSNEGMKPKTGDRECRKELNENLKPLKAFLAGAVGRPWDKVFSEISEHLDTGNVVKQHVRDHVTDFVTLNVLLWEGHPCDLSRNYGRYLQDPRQPPHRPLRKGSLYVDPVTGLLCAVKRNYRYKHSKEEKVEARAVSLAMEYFGFVGLHVQRGSYNGNSGPKTFDNLYVVEDPGVFYYEFKAEKLAAKHVQKHVSAGKFHWGWFHNKERRALGARHAYFATLLALVPKAG